MQVGVSEKAVWGSMHWYFLRLVWRVWLEREGVRDPLRLLRPLRLRLLTSACLPA